MRHMPQVHVGFEPSRVAMHWYVSDVYHSTTYLCDTECGYNTHRMCQDLVPQCQPSTYSIVAPGLPGAKLVGTFGCQVDTLFSGADVAPPFVLTVIAALDKALGTKYLYSADVKPTDVNKLRYNLLENPDVSARRRESDLTSTPAAIGIVPSNCRCCVVQGVFQ